MVMTYRKEIEQAKKEVSLLSYIISQGGQVKNIGIGKYRLDPCPVCGHKEHFTIYPDTNSYSSFSSCCKGGSIIDYLMEVEEMPLEGAISKLEALHGQGKGKCPVQDIETATEHYISPNKKEAAQMVEAASNNTTDYYTTRGLSDDIVKQYRLGYLPEGHPQLGAAFKYVMPVSEEFTIYHSSSGDVKYKNQGKTDILNKEYLQHPAIDEIYICEGVFDALSLETIGRRAISLNGVNMAGRLTELLPGVKGKRFILALDDDEPGKKAAVTIKSKCLELGLSCTILPLAGYHDVNDFLMADPYKLKTMVDLLPHKGSNYLYMIDDFEADQAHRAGQPALSTGLKQLDDALGGGLYPGLYSIGSVPSLGKTSLILQIADYLASQQQQVLFFSLEMSRYELTCRSLARILYQNNSNNRIVTGNILNSSYQDKPVQSYEEYQAALHEYVEKISRYITIREGDFNLDLKRIEEEVREFVQEKGSDPIVIVDYLQVIKPGQERLSDKQHVDRLCVGLKQLSRDLDIPLMAVSSFNREAYNSPITLKSFKESGNVEFTADVAGGLQLKGVPGDDKATNQLKNADPRQLELVLVKNRRGRAYEVIGLDYYTKFNYFAVSDDSGWVEKPF